jgi:putative ABC transport system substrate-binding protein
LVSPVRGVARVNLAAFKHPSLRASHLQTVSPDRPRFYPFRYFVSVGGLISYGSDNIEPFRRAAGYVDRILRGEKPADLPVQVPTRYELVINMKTAQVLGIDVPPMLLARAEEVIE